MNPSRFKDSRTKMINFITPFVEKVTKKYRPTIRREWTEVRLDGSGNIEVHVADTSKKLLEFVNELGGLRGNKRNN